MMQTAKLFADIMAVLMIFVILGLTLISIAAVWKMIEVQDILYKSVFSFSILSVAYVVIIVATHYWEAHQDQNAQGSPHL